MEKVWISFVFAKNLAFWVVLTFYKFTVYKMQFIKYMHAVIHVYNIKMEIFSIPQKYDFADIHIYTHTHTCLIHESTNFHNCVVHSVY